jgi:hypothetical protein
LHGLAHPPPRHAHHLPTVHARHPGRLGLALTAPAWARAAPPAASPAPRRSAAPRCRSSSRPSATSAAPRASGGGRAEGNCCRPGSRTRSCSRMATAAWPGTSARTNSIAERDRGAPPRGASAAAPRLRPGARPQLAAAASTSCPADWRSLVSTPPVQLARDLGGTLPARAAVGQIGHAVVGIMLSTPYGPAAAARCHRARPRRR